MTKLNFGYTWWGEKWLDALLKTDYSNRLPRGKSYARKGSVTSILIADDGAVVSRVQGSRPKPYIVTLSLPAFTPQEKATLLDIVFNNLLYLSSLLNSKLPEPLYQECLEKNVKLFPARWEDMKASCSCPDWADCCKHIAAVIYMIANEIDKNPFIVFQLHRLDIFSELEKKGFVLDKSAQDMKPLSDCLESRIAVQKKKPLDRHQIQTLVFTGIPLLRNQLLTLLDSNPLFYPQGDFKKILQKIYENLAKKTDLIFLSDAEESESDNRLEKAQTIRISLSDSLDETILIDKMPIDIAEFAHLLVQLPARKLTRVSDDVAALYFAHQFALKLLQKSAFIPEVISLTDTAYVLRWVPALLNQDVHGLFSKMVQIVPSELVTLQLKPASKKILKQEEAVKLLISLFIRHYMSQHCFDDADCDLRNDVMAFFFAGDILEPKRFEDKELPTTIALWLSKFYMTHKNYRPILKIEEARSHFDLSVLVENQKKPLELPIALGQVLNKPEYQQVALSLFKDLQLLETYFPLIATVLLSKGQEKVTLTRKDFPDILFKQLPILKLLGIPLLLPKGLEDILRPHLTVSVTKKTASKIAGASYLSLHDLLSFDWEIAIGDRHLSLKEFRALVKDGHGILKIRDQYVYFDEKEIQKILRSIDQAPRLTAQEALRTVLSENYNGVDITVHQAVQKMLAELHGVTSVPLPETLKATLRPYQLRGYEWLCKNARFGFGSLVADDMGLGKTVQVIAYLLKLKSENKLKNHPALVVVPTSLLTNWQKEIDKFAPDLNVHIYHGSNRELTLKNKDVFMTSYGLLRRDHDKFNTFKWPVVIIDEAQNIKNHTTAQTKAIKNLKADNRIAMTGTPVENRLSEYWSIIDFLNKGYLQSSETFKKEFAIPIEVDRDQDALERFKKMTEPFILRRVKTDKNIIKDLPDKIEMDHFNLLSKEQAALYQSVVDQMLHQIENEEGINRKGLVFKLMTSLKQICNHPAHFQKKKEIDADLSGKTSLLLNILETIFENDEKVLIFTQYTEMGELLQKLIAQTYATEALFFHGGLSRNKRDEMVERFQNERASNTLILSLKAGGTGLNLTAAKHVIHFDLWWNPAVEAQATDRVYRIGQKENVMVYRMITKDTFEEKINDMLIKKKELANLTVSNGEKWIGEFSNQELRQLFELGNTSS